MVGGNGRLQGTARTETGHRGEALDDQDGDRDPSRNASAEPVVAGEPLTIGRGPNPRAKRMEARDCDASAFGRCREDLIEVRRSKKETAASTGLYRPDLVGSGD